MSRSRRDQRGGHPDRHHDLRDCLCCPVLEPGERSRSRATREHGAEAFRLLADQPVDSILFAGVEDPAGSLYEEHVYVAGRCIRCSVDHLDAAIYPGLETCPGKAADEQISYTTATGEEPSSSHPTEP